MDLLLEKVFQNPLILKKIMFKVGLNSGNSFDKLISNLQYFCSMKLCNLKFCWYQEARHNILRAFHLKEYGKQIKFLEIYRLNLAAEMDFVALEMLLVAMPNLQRLSLSLHLIDVEKFLEFNPELSIASVKIKGSVLYVDEKNVEAVVSQILKIFGNLSCNFDDPILDHQLIKYLSKRKEPMPSFRKIKFDGVPEKNVSILPILQTVNPEILPNLKSLFIDFGMPTKTFPISLKNSLKNVCKNLENLFLLCPSSTGGQNNGILISLPPLSKLRILKLGIPPIVEGKPDFLWDLGRQLAKDFPILEKLILKNEWVDDYKYPEAWAIWEPFVPILGKENFDLSPLKTVRKVEFGLPPDWVGNGGNVDWAKSFLDVCNKLYPKLHEYYNEDIEKMLKIVEEHGSIIK